MKKLLLIALLCPLLTYGRGECEVHYLSETEESIQLSVVVSDTKKKDVVWSACYEAIRALLFDGVKGSKRRSIPYVADEYGSRNVHEAYYHRLFDQAGYYQFITDYAIVEKGKRKMPGKKIKYRVVDLNVNLKLLKYSLTEHNIIRKFGV
ncbi:MAG: hypothetical protein IJ832_01355 [Bacteroidaceae bacterium]|nr:hypothetical protein [Bacteroidaceae bacterium]